MPIMKTVLNYNRANTTNFSDVLDIPLTVVGVEVLLLEWGHTIPVGTDFVEVSACVGWEGDDDRDALELRLYQNGTLVATSQDQSDDDGGDIDATTYFRAIFTSAPDAPGTQTVFQLRGVLLNDESVIEIEGPLNVSSISYGTPNTSLNKTVLNYNRANATNISESINIPLNVVDVEVLLLEWGHTIPVGTEFVEVNACVGWKGSDEDDELELRLYQNGTLVATIEDQADDFGVDIDVTTNLKVILTSAPDAPGAQTVFQLRGILRNDEGNVNIEGPLNASSISYGTP